MPAHRAVTTAAVSSAPARSRCRASATASAAQPAMTQNAAPAETRTAGAPAPRFRAASPTALSVNSNHTPPSTAAMTKPAWRRRISDIASSALPTIAIPAVKTGPTAI